MKKAQVLFLIIITIRIILCFQPGFKVDMEVWQSWSERLINLGPDNFYDKNIWTNYTPGYLIFLWLLGIIKNNLFFEVTLKLFTNLFDIGSATLIFLIIRKHVDNFSARLGALLYLANPAVVFNSCVWGQIDGILTFFILLSFYLANEIKRIEFALPTFFASILIKPQAALYLPMLAKLSLDNFSTKKFLTGLVLSCSLYLLISMLFSPTNILFGLPLLISKMLNDYPYTSLYAFNFWALVGWWKMDSTLWNGLSLQTWGFFLFIFSILPTLILQKKNSFLVYFSVSLITLAFFLFLTRIHERYLFPFFAFFVVTTLLKKSVKFLAIYMLITFIHLYNLWYVYAKLDNNYLFSTGLILTFIILLKDFYKEAYDKKKN